MNGSQIGHADAAIAAMVQGESGDFSRDSFLDTTSDESARSWSDLLELQVACFAEAEIAYLGGLPAWKRARRVLDVGCGQGSFTSALGAAFPDRQLAGIDVSERLIARASTRSPSIDFRVADLTEFRPDKPFDAVVMRFVLQHLPDLEVVLRSCRRLLRPGGALVVIEPSLAESRNWPPTPRFVDMLAGFEARRDEDGFLKARTAGLAEEVSRLSGWVAESDLVPVRTTGRDLTRIAALYERWIAMIEASAADLVGGRAVRGELADWRATAGATSHIALTATVVTPV